jgi:hypothetical protein
LSRRGEVIPGGGVKFSVRPSILLNNRECSPLGVNEGVNFAPRGQISSLGAKFTPRGQNSPLGARGEVKNGPLLHQLLSTPQMASFESAARCCCRSRAPWASSASSRSRARGAYIFHTSSFPPKFLRHLFIVRADEQTREQGDQMSL